jgi:integrase
MKGVYEKNPGSGTWYIRYADCAGRIRKEKAGTKAMARDLYIKRKHEVMQGINVAEKRRRRVVLFAEIADEALEYSKRHKRSFRDDASRMKSLKLWFGACHVDALTVQQIENKLNSAADSQNWAASTYNHYRSLLMLIYREARRNGKAAENPARDVRHRREDNNRVRQLSVSEEKSLRVAIRKKFRWHEPELDIAINTGLRKGNQYQLEWSMVDRSRRMLHIPRTKNEEPLHVCLNKLALEAFAKLRRRTSGGGRVFLAKRSGKPLQGPRTWFDRALKDAKISGFHWHDLRHTFASRLRQQGAKLEDIAEALGHKSLMMSKRYAHLGPEGLHNVVALLDQRPGGSVTGPKTGPESDRDSVEVVQLHVQ